MKVSLYNTVYGDKIKDIDFIELFRDIQNGYWFKQILACRKALASSKDSYDRLKSKLPCFTPSGVFKTKKAPNQKNLVGYNPIVIVDFDKLDEFKIYEVIQAVKTCPYTLCAFTSPSGIGVKVLVKVASTIKQHKQAFKQVNAFYAKLTGVEADPQNSNINRACYVSTDGQAYYNKDAKVFGVQTSITSSPQQQVIPSVERHSDLCASTEYLQKVLAKLDRDGIYFKEGSRHEYIKQFSINSVKYGIALNDALSFCLDNFLHEGHGEQKTADLVHWAYTTVKADEVGIYKKYQQSKREKASTKLQQKKEDKSSYKAELYKEYHDAIETHNYVPPKPLSHEDVLELTDSELVQKKLLRTIILERELRKEYLFRKNMMLGAYEYKNKKAAKYTLLEDDQYNSMSRSLLYKGISCTERDLKRIIESEFSPRVHPLRELFVSWAGDVDPKRDYLGEVAALVKTDAPEGLWETVFRKWCVASVANVFVDNYCTHRYCPIFTGGQSTGKTKFFRALWPSDYPQYFYGGSIDLKSKDSIIRLVDTFIIQIDEQLAAIEKPSDWESLKSVITLDRIKARWHYDKGSKTAPRMGNFCASTNVNEILVDVTGNSRFLPFNVLKHIDLNKLHKINVKKLWGQAYLLHLEAQKKKFYYLLEPEEIKQIETYQERFKKMETVHHLILDHWAVGTSADYDVFFSSTEVFKLFSKEYPRENLSINSVGSAFKFLGFHQSRITRESDKARVKGWFLKNTEQINIARGAK